MNLRFWKKKLFYIVANFGTGAGTANLQNEWTWTNPTKTGAKKWLFFFPFLKLTEKTVTQKWSRSKKPECNVIEWYGNIWFILQTKKKWPEVERVILRFQKDSIYNFINKYQILHKNIVILPDSLYKLFSRFLVSFFFLKRINNTNGMAMISILLFVYFSHWFFFGFLNS